MRPKRAPNARQNSKRKRPSGRKNKPSEIFMDRAMLQRVSDRWSEYGFPGSSPVADMINRLTRPEAPAKKAKTHEM